MIRRNEERRLLGLASKEKIGAMNMLGHRRHQAENQRGHFIWDMLDGALCC